jgi:23S rRNA (pseudouridine1915-N3)-methyltransferase
MQLLIAAVGHKMPAWIETGFSEYVKRMPPELRIVLKEIKPVERSGSKTAATAMALEKERIEAVLQWQQDGRDTVFLIGGADGLDPELKARAEGLIRISSMTLPHGIVRVMLAEQLYRAWSITQNHPYHRV